MSQESHEPDWYSLPTVYVRLQPKDAYGFPPKEWEHLKAEPIGIDGIYRLQNIPFFARGLAIEDEVATGTSEEGYFPVVTSVVKRSGFSTIRIMIKKKEDRNALIDYFTARKCRLEFCREYDSIVSIAIPQESFKEVDDYLLLGRKKKRWGTEDGFLFGNDNN